VWEKSFVSTCPLKINLCFKLENPWKPVLVEKHVTGEFFGIAFGLERYERRKPLPAF
jgi:hypothetical protein